MGGNGSGRCGGRPTVEGCYRLDIETIVRSADGRSRGTARVVWQDGFAVGLEWSLDDPLYAWVQLRFSAKTYPNGRQHDVEQLVYLCRSQPHLGGDRWWFVCPRENWRVRMLYLPRGARQFASRRAYRLGYASQRETATQRAMRRARKINARLGGANTSPFPWQLPDKPKRMHWSTYRKLMQKIAAAELMVNERLGRMIARWAP
jgi:hypothetical protein